METAVHPIAQLLHTDATGAISVHVVERLLEHLTWAGVAESFEGGYERLLVEADGVALGWYHGMVALGSGG